MEGSYIIKWIGSYNGEAIILSEDEMDLFLEASKRGLRHVRLSNWILDTAFAGNFHRTRRRLGKHDSVPGVEKKYLVSGEKGLKKME